MTRAVPPYTSPIARRTPISLRRLRATLLPTLVVLVGATVATLPPTRAVAGGAMHGAITEPPGNGPGNTLTSTNWAGYQASSKVHQFTDVRASWQVPSVSCGATSTNASLWVGLGTGDAQHPLFQTGVALNCALGNAQYLAWWEEFPLNLEQDYPDPVSPGDTIQAEVSNVGGAEELTLVDTGAGSQPLWSEETDIPSSPPSVSAQCIVERPTVDSVLADLTDFGHIEVSGCDALVTVKQRSVSVAIPNGPKPAKVTARAIKMVGDAGGGLVSVKTTPHAANGDFTASWLASS